MSEEGGELVLEEAHRARRRVMSLSVSVDRGGRWVGKERGRGIGGRGWWGDGEEVRFEASELKRRKWESDALSRLRVAGEGSEPRERSMRKS